MATDSLIVPDYRALLEAGKRRPVDPDDADLIDEDPSSIKRGGLNSSHRRSARAHLAQVVRDRVDNQELVDIVLSIARAADADPMHRLAAVRTLWDRGYGRPAQLHQVDASITAGAGTALAAAALRHVDDEVLVAAVEMADQIRMRLAKVAG